MNYEDHSFEAPDENDKQPHELSQEELEVAQFQIELLNQNLQLLSAREQARLVALLSLGQHLDWENFDETDRLVSKLNTLANPTLQFTEDEVATARSLRFATPEQRTIIYEREQGTCHYCTTKIDISEMQADHKVPFSYLRHAKGETGLILATKILSTDNLICSCTACNQAKGTMEYDDFMKKLTEPDGVEWRDMRYAAAQERYK